MSIIRCFYDQNLQAGIDGLLVSLKQKKVAFSGLKDNDLIVFVNRSRTIFKMVSGTRHVVTFKALPRQRISVEDIKKVHKVFAKSEFRTQKLETETASILGKGAYMFHDGESLQVAL